MIILLDFSKALDTIWHSTHVLQNVHHRFHLQLHGSSVSCKTAVTSLLLEAFLTYINASIVQGSRIGPKGDRTKWYWTKWYGQNGTDKMVAIFIDSNSTSHK